MQHAPVRRCIPPARGAAYGAFGHVQARLGDGWFVGSQTDRAGWVVAASRAEIAACIDERYAGDPTYAPGSPFPWQRAERDERCTVIAAVHDDRLWALIATEL